MTVMWFSSVCVNAHIYRIVPRFISTQDITRDQMSLACFKGQRERTPEMKIGAEGDRQDADTGISSEPTSGMADRDV